MSDENKNCLLCGDESSKKTSLLWECLRCGLLFKNPDQFWGLEKEKARYLTHNNDVNNESYLKYLDKLFSKMNALEGDILDFGCGPEKGLESLVEKKGLRNLFVDSYDPIFFPKISKNKKYDFVYASETLEHFYQPTVEIENILNLLKPGGVWAVGTNLSDNENLEKWWYTNDPTHVAFYNQKTFSYISNKYQLEIIHFKSPHIILKSSKA